MNSPSQPTFSFTGTIPRNYDQYLGPLFFEDYAIEVSTRINPAAQLTLELCCGTGRVTNHLRKILHPASTLIASDISPDMIAIAREKLNDEKIDWLTIDAQNIPFEDNTCDQIVCCFGYMLVPDKKRAFAEALRVLRPGGELHMSTWDQVENNEISLVFRKALRKYLGDSLPDELKLPFSMYDQDLVREQLLSAGFSKVSIELVEKKAKSATAKEAAYGLVRGGRPYHELVKRDPTWVEKISDEVEAELALKYGASPMIAPMRALICKAVK